MAGYPCDELEPPSLPQSKDSKESTPLLKNLTQNPTLTEEPTAPNADCTSLIDAKAHPPGAHPVNKDQELMIHKMETAHSLAPQRPFHYQHLWLFFGFFFSGFLLLFGQDLFAIIFQQHNPWPITSKTADLFFNIQTRGLTTLLAAVITLCAIAIPLTANNYTPKLISLFIKNRVNQGMFALLVVSCILSNMSALAVQQTTPHQLAPKLVGVAILSLLCFGLIIPYAFYVFRSLQPEVIIYNIEQEILEDIDRVRTVSDPKELNRYRDQIIQDLKYLSNIALRSVERQDRDTALFSIEALRNILDKYFLCKGNLPNGWFRVSKLDFICQSGEMRRQIQASKTFLEVEIMEEYALLLSASFGRLHDVVRMLSETMRHIGLQANEHKQAKVLEMTALYFNSFLRAAISKRQAEAIYMLAYHYRRMGEEMIDSNPERTIKVAFYLDYYGNQAVRAGMVYVSNLISYDLADMTKLAYSQDASCKEQLFEIFIKFDQDEQIKPLPGIIKSHIKLAVFLKSLGHDAEAQLLSEGLQLLPSQLLNTAIQEMEAIKHPLYWEITDRRQHNDYIAPELHQHLQSIKTSLNPQSSLFDHTPNQST